MFWLVSLREVVEALQPWLASWAGERGTLRMDGKGLRGSKRRGRETGVEMLMAFCQETGGLIGTVVVEHAPLEAALAVLEGLPLEGQVVTVDAGLHQRPLV